MKAVVFQAPNKAAFADLPEPNAGPGEILVQMHASGICHTDLEVLRANYGTSAFPVVPGHEFAGTVVDTGTGVDGLRPGARVVVDPNLECGQCRACARGWSHLCDDLKAYGVTQNGGFAERCAVKASAAHPIGDMAYDIAALAEPMACVLNGVEAANGANARSALIFGAGPMGLLMAMALASKCVPEIALVDIDEARLELGESFGFKPIAVGSAALEGLRHGVELVVDATGVPSVAAHLIDYVASGGTCHFFGVCPSDSRIEIEPFQVFRRQLKIVGSHSLNHNIPQAIAAIKSFGPNISRLVSHRLSLKDAAQIFSGRSLAGSLKVQAVGL